MRKRTILVVYALLFTCFAYSCLTLLDVLPPTNPMRLGAKPLVATFETWFFQKWAFFAPPPKFNLRLYYCFYTDNPNDPEYRLEALTPIWDAKRAHAPLLNEGETLLDYVVSGSVDQLLRYARTVSTIESVKRSREADQEGDSPDSIREPRNTPCTIKSTLGLPALKTLEEYASIVAAKNNLPSAVCKAKIIVTKIDIPNFIVRDKGYATPELMLFEVSQFDIQRRKTP